MMDKPSGLPTYPQAPQSQESVLNNVLAVWFMNVNTP
jgi:hypothetical protein